MKSLHRLPAHAMASTMASTKPSQSAPKKLLVVAAVASLFGANAVVRADVRTDGSLGAVQALSGKMVVPQTLGQIKGQNLFHSFSVLNVHPGESLSFTTTDVVQNILARVTGSSASTIQGLLEVKAAAGSKPNFYLMNPQGIMVGDGAIIDVPAGLHLTTANYLQFADGQFHADLKASSSLSAAAPEAFGFVGGQNASLGLTGTSKILPVAARPISLIAGAVRIDDTWVLSDGGEIRVMAVGDAKVLIDSAMRTDLKGKIEITNGGQLDSSGSAGRDGGNIMVSGGNMQIGSPDLVSFRGIASNATADSGKAGDITVNATGTITIVAGNNITSSTYGKADAGAVYVHARDMLIDGQRQTSTGIHSNAEAGKGNAGRVNVTIDESLRIQSGGAIATSTFAEGNAGIVTVQAKQIMLDGQSTPSGILSETSSYRSNAGQGGEVHVSATDKISIMNGALISASSYTVDTRYRAGSAGNIFVQTKDLMLDGQGNDSTGIQSFTASVGSAGNIDVKASGDVRILNGASITTETNFLGAGGSIALRAKNLYLDGAGDKNTGIYSTAGGHSSGDAGKITIQVDESLTLQNSARISSATDSYRSASAGSVNIAARTIVVRGSSDTSAPRTEIASTAHANDSDLYSTGNAGSVTVKASESLRLQDGASISSSTYYKGNAGTVNVETRNLSVSNAASISSEAGELSSGQTGNVKLLASDTLHVDHAQVSIRNLASVAKPQALTATSLQLQADSIQLDHAAITAASSGNVAASQIQIDFGRQMRLSPALITTSAVSGNGGNIRVSGNGVLFLQQSQISTSVSGKDNGNGGNIEIKAPVMVLDTGAIQANTAATKAFGGDVKIQVRDVLSSGNRITVGGAPVLFDPAHFQSNIIQAAAADGVNGIISLAAPPIDVSASLGNLMPQLLDGSELIADFCRTSIQSSLTILGRGGLPYSVKNLARSQGAE